MLPLGDVGPVQLAHQEGEAHLAAAAAVKPVARALGCGYDGNAPAWIAMDSVALTELAILVAFACFGLRELVKEVRTAQHRRPL